jgi:hypothetical protein
MNTTVPLVPFRRLVAMETRKLFVTRSGAVLLAVLVALTLLAVAARAAVTDPKLFTLITTAGIGYGTLLPVLGILPVTGEWRHRTVLTTFALEPRRGRVLAATCVPPLFMAVVASAVAMLLAVPATAVAVAVRGVAADWAVSPSALFGWTVLNVLLVAMGLALGTLLLNAPAAIVIYLSAPILLGLLGRLGATGETLAGWLDLGAAAGPLATGSMTGGEAARLGVAALCWIVVPMAGGVLRVLRKEAA